MATLCSVAMNVEKEILDTNCRTLAQSPNFHQNNKLSDDSTRTLKEVKVEENLTKRTALSSVPLISVDEMQMRREGISDVAEAVRRIPGINLRDYGGAGGLKTVNVRGFGAGHTSVLYDGMPLSDVQSGQVDLSRLSTDNLQSVSLMIGDGSDIFTPARISSSSANVLLSSIQLPERTSGAVQLRGGSFGYINPFAKITLHTSKSMAFGVVGEFTHADNDYPFKLINGNITTTERRANSRLNSGRAEANMLWQPTETSSLTTKIYGYSSSRRLPGPVIYYASPSNEQLREQNAFVQTLYHSRISDKLWLMAGAKFNFASSLYHDVDGKYPGGILQQDYWQREYYATASLMYRPASEWSVVYSADYFYNNLNSNLPTDKRPKRNSILQYAAAKYSNGRISVSGRLLLSAYVNKSTYGEAAKNATKLSPSLSLSWQPWTDQQLRVRASYKSIFRMPTFNEAYFDHYGSTDILPETTEQLNLGLTFSPKASGALVSTSFSIDGYLNHVKDMIVGVPYNMFIWRMVNLGKVRVAGLDVTAYADFALKEGHTLSFNGSYSLQRAMPRTNPESSEWMKQVAYIPQHSGNACISYENPWLNLSVHGTAVSKRYTTNNNLPETKIDGYAELGASVWREFAFSHNNLELRFDILNLLNKQYCIVARYPMPGRSWRATAIFKF